jgi:uncharacterized lipoprotein YmbA
MKPDESILLNKIFSSLKRNNSSEAIKLSVEYFQKKYDVKNLIDPTVEIKNDILEKKEFSDFILELQKNGISEPITFTEKVVFLLAKEERLTAIKDEKHVPFGGYIC